MRVNETVVFSLRSNVSGSSFAQRFLRSAALKGSFIGCACVSFWTGCGTSAPQPIDVKLSPSSVTFDLLLQDDVSFRRYHVVREVVWKECGSVREESFAPSETQVSMLTSNEQSELLDRMSALVSALTSEGADIPRAAKDERNIIAVSVRQDDKETRLRTPSSTIRSAETPESKVLVRLVSLFTQRKDLACTESGS